MRADSVNRRFKILNNNNKEPKAQGKRDQVRKFQTSWKVSKFIKETNNKAKLEDSRR